MRVDKQLERRAKAKHIISNAHRQRAALMSHLALTKSQLPVTLPSVAWLKRPQPTRAPASA